MHDNKQTSTQAHTFHMNVKRREKERNKKRGNEACVTKRGTRMEEKLDNFAVHEEKFKSEKSNSKKQKQHS